MPDKEWPFAGALIASPLGAWALIAGISHIGGKRCDPDHGCLSGAPVTEYGISLIVLGSVLLIAGLAAASAFVRPTSETRAWSLFRWCLYCLPLALLFVAWEWLLSNPAFNN